jgi:hypothetical protein
MGMSLALIALAVACGSDNGSASVDVRYVELIDLFKHAPFNQDYEVLDAQGGRLATMSWISEGGGERSEVRIKFDGVQGGLLLWTIEGEESRFCMSVEDTSAGAGMECVTQVLRDRSTAFLGLDDLETLNTDVAASSRRPIESPHAECFDLRPTQSAGHDWQECYAPEGQLLYASGLGALGHFFGIEDSFVDAGLPAGSMLTDLGYEIKAVPD